MTKPNLKDLLIEYKTLVHDFEVGANEYLSNMIEIGHKGKQEKARKQSLSLRDQIKQFRKLSIAITKYRKEEIVETIAKVKD